MLNLPRVAVPNDIPAVRCGPSTQRSIENHSDAEGIHYARCRVRSSGNLLCRCGRRHCCTTPILKVAQERRDHRRFRFRDWLLLVVLISVLYGNFAELVLSSSASSSEQC